MHRIPCRRLLLLVVCLLLLERAASGSRLMCYGREFGDQADHAKVEAATKALDKQPDVRALETIVTFLGEDVVDKQIGNWGIGFTDATATAAYKAINGYQSIDCLRQTIEQGSDLAAYWALGRLERQHWVTLDGKDNHVLEAARGWVDRIAIKQLTAAVLEAAQVRSARTRALALSIIGELKMAPDMAVFTTGQLDDPDERVVAEAIRWRDVKSPQGRAIVWEKLACAKSEKLTSLCVGMLGEALEETTPEQDALLERVLKSPSSTVRLELTRSLAKAATPAHPNPIGLLLRMTDDPDLSVRASAVRSLRNAKTPEVRAKLLDLLTETGPNNVRAEAVEILGVFGKENIEAIIGAADDPERKVRVWVCMVLRHIPTPASMATLERLTNDPDQTVNTTAAEQLEWARKEQAIAKQRGK